MRICNQIILPPTGINLPSIDAFRGFFNHPLDVNVSKPFCGSSPPEADHCHLRGGFEYAEARHGDAREK